MKGALGREWLGELDTDMSAQNRNIALLLKWQCAHCLRYAAEVRQSRFLSTKHHHEAAAHEYRSHRIIHASIQAPSAQSRLDVKEQGSQANIYMLDQLTAIRCFKSRWREVPIDVHF